MIRNLPRWLPLALCVIVVGGCLFDSNSSSEPPPAPSAPKVDLGPGDTAHKVLTGPAGALDTVYIRFAADSGHRYRLQSSDSASRLKLAVTNLDTSLVFTSSATDFTKKWTMVDFPCAKSGVYLLRVIGPTGVSFQSAVQSFDGLPTTFVSPDGFEPDSSLHLAKEILPDGNWNQRTGTSSLTGDVDWVFLRTLPGRTYTFEFHDSATSYGTSHSLWASDSSRIGDPTSGSLQTVSFDTGRVYVRVDATPSGVRYRLRATQQIGYPAGVSAPDLFEHDDSLHPAVLKADSSWLGRTLHGLGSSRDTDWTRIDLIPGVTWTVTLRDSTRYAQSDLIDPSTGTGLPYFENTYQNSAYRKSWKIPVLVPTSLILRVWGTTPGSYALQAWASGTLPDSMRMGDAWEPDSRTSPAPFLADSVLRTRTLHGSGATHDTDWMTFSVDSGRTYRVVVVDSSTRIALALQGLPAGISAVLTTAMPAGKISLDTLTFPSVAKGQVVLRVWGTRACGYSVLTSSTLGLPDSIRSADPWEPDSRTASVVFAADSVARSRTLHGFGTTHDTDWMSIPVDSGKTYQVVVIDSSGRIVPSLMNLAVGISATQSPAATPGKTSYDTISFPSVSKGQVLLSIWGPRACGYSVRTTARFGLPDSLLPELGEPDNTTAQAFSLVVDGAPVVKRVVGSDSDWVVARNLPGSGVVLHIRNLGSSNLSWRSAPGASPVTIGGGATDSALLLTGRSGQILSQVWSTGFAAKINYSVQASGITLPADPLEPDDAISSPSLPTFGTAPVQRWTSKDDTDWMALNLPAGAAAKISLTGAANLSYATFSPDGQPVTRFAGPTSGDTASFYVARSGKTLLRVSTTAWKIVPYSVRIDTLRVDTSEPDGTPALAHPIVLDTSWRSTILTENDTDWYSFAVHSGWLYQIKWDESRQGVSALVMMAGKRVPLKYVFMDSAFEAPGEGTIYLAFARNGTTSFQPPPTKWRILSKPGDSLSPYSDSLHPMTILPDGKIRTTALAPTNNEWLSIAVTAGRVYSIEDIKARSFPKLEAWFLDSLVMKTDATNNTQGWRAPRDGILRIHLFSTNPFSNDPPDSIQFSLHETSANALAASQDSASAVVIPTDSTFVEVVSLKGGEDYIQFPVDASKYYRIYFQGVDSYMGISQSDILRGLFSSNEGELISYNFGNPLASGQALIRIVHMSGQGFTRYRVAVTTL